MPKSWRPASILLNSYSARRGPTLRREGQSGEAELASDPPARAATGRRSRWNLLVSRSAPKVPTAQMPIATTAPTKVHCLITRRALRLPVCTSRPGMICTRLRVAVTYHALQFCMCCQQSSTCQSRIHVGCVACHWTAASRHPKSSISASQSEIVSISTSPPHSLPMSTSLLSMRRGWWACATAWLQCRGNGLRL